jgi:DNA-binding MarR family transcriptional regulator
MDIAELQRITAEIRMLFRIVMKMSAREFNQHLAANDVDINGLQYGVIRALHHHHFTLSELSKMFILDPSTLVPVVDTLERKGLVERARDPNDRRRIPLHLTEQGVNLLKNVSLFAEDSLLGKSLTQLGEAKTLQLLELLRELAQTMPEGESMLCDMREHLDFH